MSVARKPSKQLMTSLAVGGSAGALIEWGAAALGHPLPAGTGAFLAAKLVALTHYLQKRGRAPALTSPMEST